MNGRDLLLQALDNLWRSKLRSSLTVLGVVIGVGFLVTLTSLGAGLEEVATEEFNSGELLTTLRVVPTVIEDEDERGETKRSVLHLTDAVVDSIRALPGIKMLYPELRFPVKVRLGSSETSTFLLAVPPEVAQHTPFDEIAHGRFVSPDGSSGVVISQVLLGDLNLALADKGTHAGPAEPTDGTGDLLRIEASELLGRELEIVSTTFDRGSMLRAFGASGDFSPATEDNILRLPIVGVLPPTGFFANNLLRGDAIVSLETGQQLPRMGFVSMWQLYDRGGRVEGFTSIFVRGSSAEATHELRRRIEDMGYDVTSYLDNFEELTSLFRVISSLMALLGGVGVFIATLGIANTMLTSVLERTREIGILMAVGADERDVRRIYYVEAATIGLLGGVIGLGLAWLLMQVGNFLLITFVVPVGAEPIDIFRMPAWLAAAAVAFAIVVSWIGGAYPAFRAARVDPVRALRHD